MPRNRSSRRSRSTAAAGVRLLAAGKSWDTGGPMLAGRSGPPLRYALFSADTLTMGTAAMYRAVTRNIEVTVTPRFLPERSSHEKNYFFWSYTIEISNRSKETVQ